MQIIYCMMAQNRLSEVKQCIERAIPHVDHIVIVDNGSIDESIFYLRNWSQDEPKIHSYLHPWEDNFSKQRTYYLKHAEEFAKIGDFLLISDPDELFEENIFANLRLIGDFLNKSPQYNSAGFQCRSVTTKGPKRVWENMDNYWKHLMYKWKPGMYYTGNPHETLIIPGDGLRIVNTEYIYEHIKQENVIWPRGTRNYIVNGGGPNYGSRNTYWVKLREIMKSLNINTWHDFEKYLIKGHIDQRIKNEFIQYVNLTEVFPGTNITDGLSEMRECFKYYFIILHPEEMPHECEDKHIP